MTSPPRIPGARPPAPALRRALALRPESSALERASPCARTSKRGRALALGVLLLATAACRQASNRHAPSPPPTEWLFAAEQEAPYAPSTQATVEPTRGFPLEWQPGQVLLQGYVGATYLSELTLSDGAQSVELDEDEYEVLPVVGGGAQWKLAGQGFDFGVEGLLALSGRTDLEAFATSGGATVAAFDITLIVIEAYGGPFVSRFVGDRLRLYGSAGPLLQWVSYDPDDDSDAEETDEADGSGGGVYARAGFEFLLPSGRLVGLGARWSESSVDLGGDFGDLDLSGFEVFFSYSYGLEPRSKYPW